MGRGPARPIKFREDGPRPGLAHLNFRGWAAPRPSPSHFHFFHDAARPINFSKVSARPIAFLESRPGPARPDLSYFQIGPAWPGPNKRLIKSPEKFNLIGEFFKTGDFCTRSRFLHVRIFLTGAAKKR